MRTSANSSIPLLPIFTIQKKQYSYAVEKSLNLDNLELQGQLQVIRISKVNTWSTLCCTKSLHLSLNVSCLGRRRDEAKAFLLLCQLDCHILDPLAEVAVGSRHYISLVIEAVIVLLSLA